MWTSACRAEAWVMSYRAHTGVPRVFIAAQVEPGSRKLAYNPSERLQSMAVRNHLEDELESPHAEACRMRILTGYLPHHLTTLPLHLHPFHNCTNNFFVSLMTFSLHLLGGLHGDGWNQTQIGPKGLTWQWEIQLRKGLVGATGIAAEHGMCGHP